MLTNEEMQTIMDVVGANDQLLIDQFGGGDPTKSTYAMTMVATAHLNCAQAVFQALGGMDYMIDSFKQFIDLLATKEPK
jgi:hypothetical protein